jgi:HD-GYP domain-containing protein (c-di-GMP phosphodiesterase class II)
MFRKLEKRILIIDDAAESREELHEMTAKQYDCESSASYELALLESHEKPFLILLMRASLYQALDVEKINILRKANPDAVLILFGSRKNFSFNPDEIFDFLPLPIEEEKLFFLIEKAFKFCELLELKRNYREHLEEAREKQLAEFNRTLEKTEAVYQHVLKTIMQTLEIRNCEPYGHSERIVTFSLRLGFELGLDKDTLKTLELGALLHDIGKIVIPDYILRKPTQLSEEEQKKMMLHPLYGQRMLKNITLFENVAKVVVQHHERWDGKGYPFGLKGEEIDICARILAVADAFDLMTSDEIYRLGSSYEEAIAELEKLAGTQFDPIIIEVFKGIPKEDWEILRELSLKEKKEPSSYQAIVADLVYSKSRVDTIH